MEPQSEGKFIPMRLAKADNDDFERVRDFLHAAENSLERERYSLASPEDNWMSWDDDDPDKKRIMQIRKRIAQEEHLQEYAVDHRLVMYEWLKEKFGRVSCSWRRVTAAADVLIENVCDPTLDYVEFYPGFECFHVSPEQ